MAAADKGVLGGNTVARGGDTVVRGGNTVVRGGDTVVRSGDTVVLGGDTVVLGGDMDGNIREKDGFIGAPGPPWPGCYMVFLRNGVFGINTNT
jgi:hypothetical protein